MTQEAQVCDLIVAYGTVLTMDAERRVLSDGALAVSGTKIVAIGPSQEILDGWNAPMLKDARGGIVHPGYIDGHFHAGLHLLRGYLPESAGGHAQGPSAFARWSNALNEMDEAASARMAACELVLNGFTGFVEASTAFWPDLVAETVSDIGIRSSVTDCLLWDCPGGDPIVGDMARAPTTPATIKDLGGQLWRNRDTSSLSRGHPSVYGSGTASIDLIRECRRLAREYDTVAHQHQSFDGDDAAVDTRRFGRPALVAFAEAGAIGPESFMTHMNVLSDAEAEAVAASGMGLVWHPANVLYYALTEQHPNRFPQFLRGGSTVAFGTDVAKSWSFGDLGFAAYLLCRAKGDPIAPEAILEIFTLGGARAIGMSERLGSLELGKCADLVVRSPDIGEAQPGANPAHNLALIQRTKGVDTVICNGQVIVENAALVTADLAEVAAEARNSARRVAATANLKPQSLWAVT